MKFGISLLVLLAPLLSIAAGPMELYVQCTAGPDKNLAVRRMSAGSRVEHFQFGNVLMDLSLDGSSWLEVGYVSSCIPLCGKNFSSFWMIRGDGQGMSVWKRVQNEWQHGFKIAGPFELNVPVAQFSGYTCRLIQGPRK